MEARHHDLGLGEGRVDLFAVGESHLGDRDLSRREVRVREGGIGTVDVDVGIAVDFSLAVCCAGSESFGHACMINSRSGFESQHGDG